MRLTEPPQSTLGRIAQAFRARLRLIAPMTVGMALFVSLPREFSASTRALFAWDLSASLYLGMAWFLIANASVSRTRWGARIQHDGAAVVLFLTVTAAVASLAAILVELSGMKSLSPAKQDLHVVLVAFTLVISWLLVHTAFALHYAGAFYESTSPNGTGALEFPRHRLPVYMDFFYFAMVVAMTSQTSDVVITSTRMRRLVTIHAMISFFFNTTLLALTVNIAASILD